jgi:hypothetical protein
MTFTSIGRSMDRPFGPPVICPDQTALSMPHVGINGVTARASWAIRWWALFNALRAAIELQKSATRQWRNSAYSVEKLEEVVFARDKRIRRPLRRAQDRRSPLG